MEEQQKQLRMIVDLEHIDHIDLGEDQSKFMNLNVTMLQGDGLPGNREYLGNCSKVNAFKNKELLSNLWKGGAHQYQL